MDYTTIKQVIDNTITSNSNQEITGTILNNTLNSMVDSLGAGYKYGGLVDSTYSSTPNVNYFYVATQEGAYSAFNQVIDSKGFYLLSYFDDAWKKDDIIKIAQETGDEETTLMSQKAIKEAIENIDFSIGGGSFAANLYLSNTDSDVLGYKTLSYENDLTETELTTTFSSNDGDVILGKYLFAEGLDTAIIPSGKWLMDYYMKVSTSLEETKVWSNLFVRHTNGTETVLYTDTEIDINNTSYSDNYISVERILTQYAVDETDRLGITVFAKTTRNVNLTISSIIGGVRGAYLNTPLVLKHSQLRSLNGDDNFLHITASEKASYEAKPTQADLSLKADKTYVDDELASLDHNLTTNRDANNAHPISAITGLQSTLDSKTDTTYVNTTAKELLFRDLWSADSSGQYSYDEVNGVYKLTTNYKDIDETIKQYVYELSYEEAIDTYNEKYRLSGELASQFAGASALVLPPNQDIKLQGEKSLYLQFQSGRESKFKVINLANIEYVNYNILANDITGLFTADGIRTYTNPIKTILGYIELTDDCIVTTNSFFTCPYLETVYLKNLGSSINFKTSSNLSKESVLYAIENCQTDKTFSVTLHADAYTRLSVDSDIIAALNTYTNVTLISA